MAHPHIYNRSNRGQSRQNVADGEVTVSRSARPEAWDYFFIDYLESKGCLRKVILLWQVGDIFLLLFEDAKIISQALDLTLTTANFKYKGNDIPMCTIPAHEFEHCDKQLRELKYRFDVHFETEYDKMCRLEREIRRQTITPERLAQSGTEHAHQTALFCWANDALATHPELDTMFAIPNGGYRDGATAARLAAEGVKAGIPDICLPIARGRFHSLWIELKKPTGRAGAAGRATADQLATIERLRECGHAALVCVGWERARDVIVGYLVFGTVPD